MRDTYFNLKCKSEYSFLVAKRGKVSSFCFGINCHDLTRAMHGVLKHLSLCLLGMMFKEVKHFGNLRVSVNHFLNAKSFKLRDRQRQGPLNYNSKFSIDNMNVKVTRCAVILRS